MEEILINELTLEGIRHLRVVGDRLIDPAPYFSVIPRDAEGLIEVSLSQDEALGLHYADLTWPAREALDYPLPEKIKFRRLVVWTILEGERMSEVISRAVKKYKWLFGIHPGCVFAGYLPNGIENGQQIDGAMHIFQVDWLPKRVIAVGGVAKE